MQTRVFMFLRTLHVDAFNPAQRTSAALAAIKLSPTFKLEMRANAMRAEGRDVVMLGAGEPDFPTPAFVIEAASAAARAGQTRYTPMVGTRELREAIARKLQRDHGLGYGMDQIIASAGAKQSLFNVLRAVLDPGDEVVLPAPCWVSYGDMATLAGGVARYVHTRAEDGFVLQAAQLEAMITPRTRVLLLNSPNNPTGVVYSREDWRALGEVLERHPGILVVSDDIYEKIILDASAYVHFLQACPQMIDRTVLINGVSKAYAMTGWRLGYAAGPKKIVKAMELVQSQTTSCASSVSQAAAQAALDAGDAPVHAMLTEFRARHAYLLEALARMPLVRCQPAKGAFYLFADIRALAPALALKGMIANPTDLDVAEWLLEAHGLGLVPGSAFEGPGFLRLSFAASLDTLQDAMRRLSSALEVLQ